MYFTRCGQEIIVLLCGGDKSTQSRDIDTAKSIAAQRQEQEVMSKIEPTRWDAADELKTSHDCALYLEAVMEEADGDEKLIAAALGDIARSRGMMQLSRDTGQAREALYRALSSDGNPSFATVLKVTKALGLRLTVTAANEAA